MQTSKDNKTWTEATTQTFSENGTMYARLTDGTNYGGTAAYSVTNIDTVAPTINTELTGTGATNSITLNISVSDNLSGVNKIIWYYKLSSDSNYTSATDEYTATTANTKRTHTFTGLTQGKTYNAYAVVYDAVGKTTQSKTINVTTSAIPSLVEKTNITFTSDPTGWTSENVKVTAELTTTEAKKYTLQTKANDGSWSNTASQTFSENGTMYVRLTDGTNYGGTAAYSVTNIDKQDPTAKITLSKTKINIQKSVTANVISSDTGGSELNFNNCKYAFTKETNEIYYDNQITSDDETLELTANDGAGTYYLYIKLYDNAGNYKIITSDPIEVLAHPDDDSVQEDGITFSTNYGWVEIVWLNTSNQVISSPEQPVLEYKVGDVTESLYPAGWSENNNSFSILRYDDDLVVYETEYGDQVETWYDYDQKQWANAETDNGDLFVWIPRYAYRIHYYMETENNYTETGYYDGYGQWSASDGKIRKALDSGIQTVTYEDEKYIIPPAFCDGTDNDYENGEWSNDLEGFWCAKFEARTNDNGVYIQPNLEASDTLVIYEQYNKAITAKYGYTLEDGNENVDGNLSFMFSHMMKNSEWGAVAYLTQSFYGTVNYDTGDMPEVAVNNSSLDITGNSGGSGDASSTDTVYEYNTAQGVKASTTQNVYGIYDMNGGAWENVAAFNSDDTTYYVDFYFRDFLGEYDEISQAKSTKYLTKYSNASTDTSYNSIIYSVGKVGDATKEVNKGGIHEISDNILSYLNWYNDYSKLLNTDLPFIKRGGGYQNSYEDGEVNFEGWNPTSGIFAITNTDGNSSKSDDEEKTSFRTVLCPNKSSVPDLITSANVTFSSNTTGWTNKDVTVTATSTLESSEYKIQTSKDAVNWSTTASQTFSENGTMYVRLYDGKHSGKTATFEVGNIDKSVPKATITLSTQSTNTEDSPTATVKHTDTGGSKVNVSKSKWEYNTTSSKIGTDESKYSNTFTSTTETITLIATKAGTYYLHVLTTDNAGNTIETVSKAITVIAHPNDSSKEEDGITFSTNYGKIDVIWLDTDNNVITSPNAPVLKYGKQTLNPVMYDSSSGEFDDAYSTDEGIWYDYSQGQWANATTTNGSYFVWIPRYAYRITYYDSETSTEPTGYYDGYGQWCASDGKIRNAIDDGIETVSYNNEKYIVHPSFETNLDNGGWSSDIEGFWCAKYEASQGTESTIEIKPNASSWRNQTIGEIYENAITAKYGYSSLSINSDGNTSFMYSHLIKNSEWGAVAYLTHSKFGTDGKEIAINNNVSYITGNSSGSTSASYSSSTYAYNTTNGKKASTTGTVDGIYDMSGGVNEYVAAFNAYDTNGRYSSLGWDTVGNVPGIKGTVNSAGETSAVSNKYATKYYNKETTQYGNPIIYTVGKIGDATKEVNKGGKVDKTSSTNSYYYNWFSDIPYLTTSSIPFTLRGETVDAETDAGIFASATFTGSSNSNSGFRTVLTPNTNEVPSLTDANITFTFDPSTQTTGSVTVTATTTETEYTLQTSKDGATWLSTASQTFTENGTMYARLTDGKNYGGMATASVTNIILDRSGINVGDYVDYVPDTATDYSKFNITSSITGSSNNTSDLTQETLNWQVLRIYDDGSMDLIGSPTSKEVEFDGILGYNNGVYILNNICEKLYSKSSKGITARSVNLEDMEKWLTTSGKTTRNSYSNNVTKYGETKTYTESRSYKPDIYENAEGQSDSYYTKPTTKTYSGGGTSNTLSAKQNLYKLDINNTNYSNGYKPLQNSTTYWLASRYVDCYGTSDYADFGLYCADSSLYGADTLYESTNVNGRDKYSLRPVVTLAANIKVTPSTGTNSISNMHKITYPDYSIGFTFTPSTQTSENVVVTASTTLTGYTLQTSRDGSTWSNTANQIFTENGTMYARLTDGTKYYGLSTASVTNIEKVSVVSYSDTATIQNNTIDIDWATLDLVADAISKNNNISNNTSQVTVSVKGETKVLTVGDTLTVSYTSSNTNQVSSGDKTVRLIGFKHDKKTDDSYAGMTFEFVDILEKSRFYYSDPVYPYSWGNSEIRSGMSDYLNRINDEDLKNNIETVVKTYGDSNETTTSTCNDQLFLLSCSEIWNNAITGSLADYKYGGTTVKEEEQYKYYSILNPDADGSNQKIAKSAMVWLRSHAAGYGTRFCVLDPTNGGICRTLSYKEDYYITPVFSI